MKGFSKVVFLGQPFYYFMAAVKNVHYTRFGYNS